MNGHRLFRRLAACLVIASGLLLLTGCQSLAGGTNSGGGSVGVTSATLNFGAVAIGSSKTLPDALTNTTSSAVTISSIQGLGSGFQLTGITLPLVLGAGQSAPFNVTYRPATAGDPTTTISFVAPNAQTLASLSATATAVTPGELSPSPSSVAFGKVSVGSNQASTVSLANSGGADLSITQATMSGAGFTMSNLALPLTIKAGAATPVTITFAPTKAGSFSGSVTFATSSDQENSNVVVQLSGTGVAASGTLSPSSSSLAFGSVTVGNNSSLSETLTNTGGSSVTISTATVSGAAFSLGPLTLPATLTANQSVTFTVTFTPTTTGAASGSLSVVSNATNSPLDIALSGTGTTAAAGTLAVSPTTLSFGSVVDGSSSQLTGKLSATGASVKVSSESITGANNGDFVLSGISFPVTIPAGQSSTFTVTFTPKASGTASASLSFASNASNSPAVQSLTGTGKPYVALAWNASDNATGYNVYRGTVNGGPYPTKLNTSLIATTTYNDSTVVSGQDLTYYYVTTAVAGSSESGYSDQASATIQ